MYDGDGNPIDSSTVSPEGYDSAVHGPPLYIDIYVEMMTEQDNKRAAELTIARNGNEAHADVLDFVDRHARRYVTRVHFPHRTGYLIP